MKVFPASALFIAFVVACLSGCHRAAPDEFAPVDVGNEAQYAEAMKEAKILGGPIIPKYQDGGDVTVRDRDNLTKVARLYEGMLRYKPTAPAPNLAVGIVYQILGRQDLAMARFNQYLISSASDTSDDGKVTKADTHWLLSVSLFRERRYQDSINEVDKGLDSYPQNAQYLTQRASDYLQLGQKDKAKADAEAALEQDPEQEQAKGILNLLRGAN